MLLIKTEMSLSYLTKSHFLNEEKLLTQKSSVNFHKLRGHKLHLVCYKSVREKQHFCKQLIQKRIQSLGWPEVFSKLTEMQRIILAKKMKSVFQVEHLIFWFTKKNIWSCCLKMVYCLNVATFFLLSFCKGKSLATLKPFFLLGKTQSKKFFHPSKMLL